ncbi:MAG: sodium:proton antiporter [Candidatus Pacebacteria bacterium]|nr:sodium:proton antiporter [Candidatus Paceibacterota bacterium]
METHHFAELIIFIGGFLLATSFLQELVKKIKFPYTVALLILGFLAQYLAPVLHIPAHVEPSPDFTFFFLLPILLFGASMHIRLHQFKLQFKTISFAATFGLLVSLLVVGFGVAWLLGLPFSGALLFGALISATDPIAVLAIFKTLGAPKRLALLADGESMFNDATAVIAFRILVTIASGATVFSHHTVLEGLQEFTYVFVGSILVGAGFGYVISSLIAKVKNDFAVETTLTLGASLLAFTATEHFFHLSGVISSVIAGLVVGNMGRSRFSPSIVHMINELWEYLGFLAVSVVFFFATYSLDIKQFLAGPERWLTVIGIVIVARAISTYLTYFLTNHLPFFKDEPNVPVSWQHILNWGGLRGVIPLVLVFSIPDEVWYKQELLIFTFAVLLFSLFVNGLTIDKLLRFLKLHVSKKEEKIYREEKDIFALEKAKSILFNLPKGEFNTSYIKEMERLLLKEENLHKKKLDELVSAEDLEKSLRLQLLSLQRDRLEHLFWQGYVSEDVMLDFDAQLDLQEDALEYPEVYKSKGYRPGGKINGRESLRKKILKLKRIMNTLPVIKKFLVDEKKRLIAERFYLLKARVITSHDALDQLDKLAPFFNQKAATQVFKLLKSEYEEYIAYNNGEIDALKAKYGKWIDEFQARLLKSIIYPEIPDFVD